MRALIVRLPRGFGPKALAAAARHGGRNLSALEGSGEDGPVDVVLVHVPNDRLEGLLDDLQDLPDLHVTFEPRGVITLHPPRRSAPDEALDVGARSPIEVLLGGLQSVGSWNGFLGYAAAAGVVVWIGLFTNTVYLLTAAMLIAPYAGPAMNAALATARGDPRLFGRSVLRYVAALATTIAVAFALSLVFSQDIATEQMVERSQISAVAALLPLVAGAAGALNLCQSERNSLVSGAATGMLVAASLAPPAGLVGMAAAIGEWDLVGSAVFVLVLQLVGINLSGAVVFRLFGIAPRGVRFARGRPWFGWAAGGASALALLGLVAFQLSDRPMLQRSSTAQRAAALVQSTIDASGLAKPVHQDVRFTRADIPGQNTLLVRAWVQAPSPDPAIGERLAGTLRERLRASFDVTPLVDVTVLAE